MAAPAPTTTVSMWIDHLQSSGRYTFTRAEALAETGKTETAVAASLRRLCKAGRIVSPRRGFHVVVPLEYRTAGAPPAEWFVDDLMHHLRRPYYVGLLSAAALHGAAHHAPQVFQVITDVPTRPLTVGRVRVVFVQGRAGLSPTQTMNTPTGTLVVSTPEATALDLVRHATVCGGSRVSPPFWASSPSGSTAPVLSRHRAGLSELSRSGSVGSSSS